MADASCDAGNYLHFSVTSAFPAPCWLSSTACWGLSAPGGRGQCRWRSSVVKAANRTARSSVRPAPIDLERLAAAPLPGFRLVGSTRIASMAQDWCTKCGVRHADEIGRRPASDNAPIKQIRAATTEKK